jgi:hypothetical protein
MATATETTVPVIETPLVAEAEIPRANIRAASGDSFPDDAWLNIRDVPVFAEHATSTQAGRELAFGRRELAALAANCNRRIRDTGDYAGIVIGHTPDPAAAPHAAPMPLIGLAGPFRMGLIQLAGGQPKWAILADFHVRREHAAALRDYPRRSAELWVEDAYEEMYLDPIALLGAETPRLDMGLLYSAVRRRDGKHVEKYSACAPGPASVFVPGSDAPAKKRHDYSAESDHQDADAADSIPSTSDKNERTAMPFSPEDVKQIVDALEQTDVFQWARTQMRGSMPTDQPVETPPVETPLPAPAPEAAATPALPPKDDDPLPVKYSRMAGELSTLRGTMEKLRGQLDEERSRRVNTERYAALSDIRRTRLFDLDSEFELVKYGKMSDAEFGGHIERIGQNYREIPLDTSLPTFDLPAAMGGHRPGGAAAKEKYSREVSDKALAIAKRKAMRGEDVSYEEVLEQVANGEL